MKIACLQFAPQVGDVDNNLNRADSILNKAKAEDLENLDLLVLPELAFSGYNFRSLQHIAPYLEPPGSGISSLWARTTALKYDCSVIVGYPEKVDVSVKWPASPEYYNSALVVNGDGDTIANYRKSFLYYTDETWALEGKDGFFRGEIPRIGDVAMGICMDLNPYKFEAEWDAFEFGYHALDSEANVVILSMAWTTEQDPRIFSRRPQDPDLETLVYWVQRLEPLIRIDREGEVIVVICNRCGSEDDVTYAGTSAVLGILQGEVYVYGVLGRGVKDLLVVDTENLPPSKLTDAASMEAQRQSHEADVAEYLEMDEENVNDNAEVPDPASELIPDQGPGVHDIFAAHAKQPMDDDDDCAIISDDDDDEHDGGDYLSPLPTSPLRSQQSPLFAGRMSGLMSQLRLVIPTGAPVNDPTPIEIDSAMPDSAIPRSAIPQSAIDDDIIIDSPGITNPSSPVQFTTLPKLAIPSSPWRFRKKPTPYPWQQPDGPQPQIFGGGKVCMTPITPFDTGSPIVHVKSGPQSAAWRPAQAISSYIPEAIPEDEVEEVTVFSSSKKPSSGHTSRQNSRQPSRERYYNGIIALDSPEKVKYRESKQLVAIQAPEPGMGAPIDSKEAGDTLQNDREETGKEEENVRDDAAITEDQEEEAHAEKEEQSPVPDLGELSAILERLRVAEGCSPALSLHENRAPPKSYEPSQSPCPERPFSPKSLNASRSQSRNQSCSRLMQLRDEYIQDPASDERMTSISRGTIPISASPSVFDTEPYYRPQSIPISASPSLFSSINTDTINSPVVAADPLERPMSRMGHQRRGSKDRVANLRSLSLPAVYETHPQPRSASLVGHNDVSGGRHQRRRSSLRIATTNLDEQPARIISRDGSREGSRTRSSSSRRRNTGSSKSGKRHRRRRNVSRGRQPGARGTSVDRSDSVGETRSQVSRRRSLQRPESETQSAESNTHVEKRTRTCSGSRRSGRRRSTAPPPLVLKDPVSALGSSLPDGSSGIDGGGVTDVDTEIEIDDVDAPEGNQNDDDVLIGSIKRIAPDCPHHSPFRRTFRHERRHHHQQEDVNSSMPPPAHFPPVAPLSGGHTPSSSSLLTLALSHSAMSAGGWTLGGPPLLSASSAEGGFSSNLSETSPMSPDPETPRFFGVGPSSSSHSKTMILSELVSTSTVASPSEQIQMQLQSHPVQLTGKDVLSEAVGDADREGDAKGLALDSGVFSSKDTDGDLGSKGPTEITPPPVGGVHIMSKNGIAAVEETVTDLS